METLNFSSERAAIRFAIDGSWTVDEFADFLRQTSDAYTRINALFIPRSCFDFEPLD